MTRNTLGLIAHTGLGVSLLAVALGGKEKFWRITSFVIGALNLAVVLAYFLGWA